MPEIVSVAAFLDDEDKRTELQKSFEVRAEAARRCLLIEGFRNLPLDEKNRIYDENRDQVIAEMEANNGRF